MDEDFDSSMYMWAVEMAHVWQVKNDLDGYCYWWAWRIDERWDEKERTEYEAWKYAQLREYEKRDELAKLLKSSKSFKSYQKPQKLSRRRKN